MITHWFYMQVLTRIGARRFYRAFYLNILQPSNMSLLYDSLTSNIKKKKISKIIILET